MIKKLAIKGHPTRGKEIIEILEMMGGKNIFECSCHCINYFYYICESREGIQFDNIGPDEIVDFSIFTLEEFLEIYPFKVGDKVFLYDNITEGCITGMKWDEENGTVKYCVYTSIERWCDVEELLKWNAIDLVEKHYMDNMEEKDKAKAPDIKGEDYSGKRFGYKIPDGYEFDVLVDGKIFLKPIKPKYPTTYDECCNILNADEFVGYELMTNFPKLINARNAYWKIAGEQMCLGKPWEPDWDNSKPKYTIIVVENELVRHYCLTRNHVLAFPTEEMRDAFYENFKDLIEQCKELL